MQIHAINTGMLSIRRMHRRGLGFDRWSRLASWLLVPGFAPPIPMLAWLIEHPDGPIVVDTGEVFRAQDDPTFFPEDQRRFMQRAFRFELTADDEIGPQLSRLGVRPYEVETVVLTHAHMDHTDGLNYFPKATFWFSAREWHDCHDPRYGAVTARWPKDMTVNQVSYVSEPVGPFDQSFPVTADGRVRLIPTPGHTMGHQSVVVQGDDVTTLIAGDVSFTEAELFSNRVDGVTHDARAARRTRDAIREWAASEPLVYLPSHDPQSMERLKNTQTVKSP